MSNMKPAPKSNSGTDQQAFTRTSAPWGFALAAVGLLVVIIAACWRRVDSSELLFHLRAGKVIQDTGQVPNRDIFSAASLVDKWSYIEWLWAGVLSLIYKVSEWDGINALNVALAALLIFLLLRRCRTYGSRWFESITMVAFTMTALLPVFQPGPAIAVLPLFAVALMLGEGRRLWPLALLPGVALLWANVHAGFFLPLLVPVARFMFPPPGQEPRQPSGPRAYLAVIIAASIFAAFVTPHSVYMIPEVFGRLTHNLMASVNHPVETLSASAFLIRAFAVVAMMVAIFAGRLKFHKWQIFTAGILAVACFFTDDALNFLLIFLSAPAALALNQFLARVWEINRVRMAAATALLLTNVAFLSVVIALSGLTPDSFGAGLNPRAFPETAAGRLSAIPLRASILNTAENGGYLTWRLWPNWKICIDQRATLYSPEFREEYEKLWAGAVGWESRMTLWRVNAILGTNEILQRHPDQNLFHKLAVSSEWVPVFWDSYSILYLKQGINLSATNLSEFRQLKPGLPWPAMKARLKTAEQWREFGADLRRANMDDPNNAIAREFLKRTEAEAPGSLR